MWKNCQITHGFLDWAKNHVNINLYTNNKISQQKQLSKGIVTHSSTQNIFEYTK
jgi:hypothetical protein